MDTSTRAGEHDGGEHEPGTIDSGEGLAQELIARVAALEGRLAGVRGVVDAMERRRAAVRAAAAGGAVDADSAGEAMLEHWPEDQPAERGLARALERVRAERPGLFAPVKNPRAPLMSAAGAGGEDGRMERLARQAASGDRLSLLEYLRARRGA